MTKTIMRVKFGSHLYGTTTPTSDVDYKSVHLPSARAILLGHPEKHLTLAPRDSSRKNTAEDVDDESFSVQRWLEMVAKGDMIAYELLFAPKDSLEVCTDEWSEILTHRDALLSSTCKGFVGYVQRQAAKYGIKGSRMATCRAVVAELQRLIDQDGDHQKMSRYEGLWTEFAAKHEHTRVEFIESSGQELWYLDVCDRKMSGTVTLQNALGVYKKVFDNYGARARAAETNEGVDWKAIMHAVRVGEQAVELLSTGNITFPRPNARMLLAIKQGVYSYDEIAPRLEVLLSEVERLGPLSRLPAEPNRSLIDDVVAAYNLAQIRESYL